jgi:hypothetical protein
LSPGWAEEEEVGDLNKLSNSVLDIVIHPFTLVLNGPPFPRV